MRTRKLTLKLGAAALTCTALALTTGQVFAAEYWLRAGTTTVNLPNPTGGAAIPVVMWGYATCTANFESCGTPTVPGPALTVPVLDTTLTVNLRNDLLVPTSLVINGLIKPMTPVWDTGAVGPRPNLSSRVRSFDAEATAASSIGSPGGIQTYTWGSAANPVRPGTYLYQSGTQPQVQVQMGLYGAATKNVTNAVAATATAVAIPGQAYAGTGYAFDNEATLLYSEIDPVLNAAIANGSYGTAPAPTSTINYTPKYFLINGAPYQFGTSIIEPVGSPGTTLLRLLNAGLTTHVPMIQGKHWDVIAEDGKPYTYRRTQYTALLPAAKTLDVLFTPDVGATYPIMDRRLSLSNNGASGGGMMAFLRFGSLASMAAGGGAGGNAAPVASADAYDSVRGVTLNIAAPGVLTNDTDSTVGQTIKAVAAGGTTANGGTYTLNADGSFTYTPLASYAGTSDSFTYQATDGKALSAVATVTIALAVPAAPTLTVLDDFTRANATSLGANWSQQVPTAPPVPDLGVTSNAAVANTTALGGLAIWNAATFGATQGAGFTSGGPAASSAYLVLKATGGTPIAPANYVRVGCEGGQVVVATMMGGSNAPVYVKQAAFGACSGGALSAVVDAKGLVTVFQGSAFAGGVQLPDVAAWKGGGRIGIQLTTVDATADDFAGGTLAGSAPPPTLTSIAPNSGAQGATVAVTLSGANLTGASAVTVSGTGVTCGSVAVPNDTTVTASCAITAGAAPGARTVTVTTPGGTSGNVTFTVNAAPPVVGTVSLTATFTQQLTGTPLTGATLTSTNLNFGNQIGAVFSSVTFTISGAPVIFGAATVANGTGTAFSKGADTCSNQTVAVGGTCTIRVNFNAPLLNSPRTGTLTVPHNGTANPTVRALTGS